MDTNFNLKAHNEKKIKMAWYQLSLLKKVNLFLPESDVRTTVQAFALLHLDGGNALLHGLPDSTLAPVKGILQAAARLTRGLKYNDHFTPILM